MPFRLAEALGANLPRLTLAAAVDILIVAYLIYQLLLVVKGTRAAHILVGLCLLGVLYYVSRAAGLETIQSMMANLIPYSMLAILVLFQSEIRRILGRLGRRRLFRSGRVAAGDPYDDILLAVTHLSQAGTGALVVLERDTGLRTFVESGVSLDARLSHDVLLAIFHPGGPLHDGAVIIQQDRIAAAACFLPLTTNPALSGQLGTRHRAAIGVTEESDSLAVVVAEKSGLISLASAGGIERELTPDQLRRRLISLLGRHIAPLPPQPGPTVVRDLVATRSGEVKP